jgi:nitrate reductase NapE component
MYMYNMHPMLTKPSFYSLLLTGVIWLVLVIIFVKNYSFFKNSRPDKLIEIISLIGLVIGVHGLLHLGMESVYGFNPME